MAYIKQFGSLIRYSLSKCDTQLLSQGAQLVEKPYLNFTLRGSPMCSLRGRLFTDNQG